MATDYTKPTYSSPELGFDVPAYVKKYYDDLAAKKAEEDSAQQNQPEGAGVRSSQLWDSPDPKTRKAVGWGGGEFTQGEVDSGVGLPSVTRYTDSGEPVDMGNRTAGLAVMKMMEKLPQAVIPGYAFAKVVDSMINKPGQTTASTESKVLPSPFSKPQNILEVVDDTDDDEILTTASTPTTNYSWPEITGTQQSWNTGTSNVNPLNASEMGILDMLRQAAEQNADEANVAIDMNAPVVDNKPF